MTNRKSIAIVMATYNGSKYIKKQLQSILNQTYSDFRVYISDDNSKDQTIELIRSFNDPRVMVVKNTSEKGVVGNFNNALSLTTEDIILLSDQDDMWPEDRLDKMLQFYDKDAEPDLPYLLFTDMTLIDSHDKVINESFYQSVGLDPYYNKSSDYLTWRCTAYGCTMLFNRYLLDVSLPLPSARKTDMHDNWLLLCALSTGNVGYYNYKSVFYRQHESNHTGGGNNSFLYKLKNLKNQILTIDKTQKKRLLQLNVMSERGLFGKTDVKKYKSVINYISECILPFKKERKVYVFFYCVILILTCRFKSSLLKQ